MVKEMKKIGILFLITALCVLLCACAQPADQPASEATAIIVTEAPQLHTIAPTVENPEPEWCPVEDCKLTFNDSDGVAVLNEKDIQKFALIGSDDSASLVFALTDEAEQMMSAAPSTESFTAVLNDEELGTAYFSDTQKELTLSGLSLERLCEIASSIRGLE